MVNSECSHGFKNPTSIGVCSYGSKINPLALTQKEVAFDVFDDFAE